MLIAFDGVCVLCNRFVRFLLRHDRQRRFRFASSESKAGSKVFAAMGQRPDYLTSMVLVDGTARFTDSEAALRAVAALGGVWRVVGGLRLVPKAWRDGAYRLVARNRYRWFGRTDHCPLPDPVWRERFLE